MKNFIKKKSYNILDISLIPAVIVLGILKHFLKIKLWRLRSQRIGHLVGHTDTLLRKIKLGEHKGQKHVLISCKDVANQSLIKMYKRKIKIIQIPQPILLRSIIRMLATRSILHKTKLFEELPINANTYYEFNNTTPCLEFTVEEEQKGKKIITQLKIDSWYICFHARDSAYLDSQWKKGDSYHNFRNCNINNFLKAAEFISNQGGSAVRMGVKIDKPLIDLKKPKIIDYATNSRSDFGDVYLLSKCKFFLANDSGLITVSYAFNVPVALVNVVQLNYLPLGKKDLFITRKFWSLKEKKFLTFENIYNSEILNYAHAKDFEKSEIQIIENTPEEILDLTIEMNKRLDGTWETTIEDEELQQKFRDIIKSNFQCYGFPSRIGAKFLQENKHLLES